MADRMTVGHLYPNAVPPGSPAKRSDPNVRQQPAGTRSFQDVFRDSLVRVSHHAEVRLQQRGIELKPEQMAKIQSAIEKAAAKGSKESLILMDNMAMIVNVKNKTIVTAMDGASMKDNVFTQIDSAVII
ncbi:TIGR02530 family flagellar biosynthesis protein [Paenibacillus flagellatus]|uniref:Flagellar biosynthesis protein n=1 Tax=Paenibacillus flagellatus TaxID=2211139 RepID=A0A2V5JYW7_9BACL|nr:TIGR02530 family flagellar biosynthesis protein [Paenibacillus flagellatus]PYI50373.1 flagellar biosynthesis protein [Paenibacillus flagellatus]